MLMGLLCGFPPTWTKPLPSVGWLFGWPVEIFYSMYRKVTVRQKERGLRSYNQVRCEIFYKTGTVVRQDQPSYIPASST